MSYRLIGMNINLRSLFHKQSDYFIHARPNFYSEKILISYIINYRNRMRFKFSNNLCQGGKGWFQTIELVEFWNQLFPSWLMYAKSLSKILQLTQRCNTVKHSNVLKKILGQIKNENVDGSTARKRTL